jgi:hypothetical protein
VRRELQPDAVTIALEIAPGLSYARIKAIRGSETSQASNEVEVGVADMKDVIEALFLGTGRLARIGNPGCADTLQRMRGWRHPTRVRVVAYTSADAVTRAAIQEVLPTVQQVFEGKVTATYESDPARVEPSDTAMNEISVFMAEGARWRDFCANIVACARTRSVEGVRYTWAGIIFQRPYSVSVGEFTEAMAHEFGHAFGLCHIDFGRANLDQESVMDTPDRPDFKSRWADIDVHAFRLVHNAGLSPGATRQQFVGAGLIY